ncbi:hypothetical protein B9Z19DRAFT_1118986 [Tuber borchii]|uniref:Uncharacterized protein n=1 Tax=Tuber borchii TaxID=42251 RepID=A0A2T7A7F4_TUBBO|nr:hypothetical protein B9Z19DRAFT_1118986 [Tuber borchii]
MFVNRIARSTLAHQSRMFHMRPAHRLPVHSFGLSQPQATRIIQPIRSQKYSTSGSICERNDYVSQVLYQWMVILGLSIFGMLLIDHRIRSGEELLWNKQERMEERLGKNQERLGKDQERMEERLTTMIRSAEARVQRSSR